MKTDELEKFSELAESLSDEEESIFDNVLELFRYFREPNSLETAYEQYLKQKKKKGKSITKRGIDWKDIAKVYDDKFAELWNKIGLPKSIYDYNSIKELYISDIFFLIRENIFENIYSMANFPIPKFSTTHTKEDAINILGNEVDKMLAPIYRMRELIIIGLEEDPKAIDKLISESSKLNRIIEQGKKFYGKKYRKDEVEVFELIISEYKRLYNTGYKVSWRVVSDKFAEDKFNYSSIDDIENFYKRFLNYKNK